MHDEIVRLAFEETKRRVQNEEGIFFKKKRKRLIIYLTFWMMNTT